MIDVWRESYEKSREFSRRQYIQGHLKQSRIDFILCKREMEEKIGRVFYKEASFSDHNYSKREIDPSDI